MKCEEIQILLSDENLDSGVVKHLEQCSECQQYKRDIEGILKISNTYQPSKELDNNILAFARQNRPVVNKATTKPLIPFYIWAAIATAAIIVIAFVFFKDSGLMGTSQGDGVVKEDKQKRESLEDQQKMVNASLEESDVIMELWEEDLLDIEMSALEGELFVLGNELE
jgi:hypothetical protein